MSRMVRFFMVCAGCLCLLAFPTGSAVAQQDTDTLPDNIRWQDEETLEGFITGTRPLPYTYLNEDRIAAVATDQAKAFAWSDTPIALHIPFEVKAPGQWVRVLIDIRMTGFEGEFPERDKRELVSYDVGTLSSYGVMRLDGKPIAEPSWPEGVHANIRGVGFTQQALLQSDDEYPAIGINESSIREFDYHLRWEGDEPRPFVVTDGEDDNLKTVVPIMVSFSPSVERGWYSFWFVISPESILNASRIRVRGHSFLKYRDEKLAFEAMPDSLRGTFNAALFQIRGDQRLSTRKIPAALGLEEASTNVNQELSLWERLPDVQIPLRIQRNGWVLDSVIAKVFVPGSAESTTEGGETYPYITGHGSNIYDAHVTASANTVDFNFSWTKKRAKHPRREYIDYEPEREHWEKDYGDLPVFSAGFANEYHIEFPDQFDDYSMTSITISGSKTETGPNQEILRESTIGRRWHVWKWNPGYEQAEDENKGALPLYYYGPTIQPLEMHEEGRQERFLSYYGEEYAPYWTAPVCPESEWDLGERSMRAPVYIKALENDQVYEDLLYMGNTITVEDGLGVATGLYRRRSHLEPNDAGSVQQLGNNSDAIEEKDDGFYTWFRDEFHDQTATAEAAVSGLRTAAILAGVALEDMAQQQRILLDALTHTMSISDDLFSSGSSEMSEATRESLKQKLQQIGQTSYETMGAFGDHISRVEAQLDQLLQLIDEQQQRSDAAGRNREELKRWRTYYQNIRTYLRPDVWLSAGQMDLWRTSLRDLETADLTARQRFELAHMFRSNGDIIDAIRELRRVIVLGQGTPLEVDARKLLAALEGNVITFLERQTAGEIAEARRGFQNYLSERGLYQEDTAGLAAGMENWWLTFTTGPAAAYDAATGGSAARAELSGSLIDYGTVAWLGFKSIGALLKRGHTLEDIEQNLTSLWLSRQLPMLNAAGKPFSTEEYRKVAASVRTALDMQVVQDLLSGNPVLVALSLDDFSLDERTGADLYLETSNSRSSFFGDAFSAKNLSMLLLPMSVASVGGRLATVGYWGEASVAARAATAGAEIVTGQELIAASLGWGRALSVLNNTRLGPWLDDLLQRSYTYRSTGGMAWQAAWGGGKLIANFTLLFGTVQLAEKYGGPRIAAATDALLSTFLLDPDLCWNLLRKSRVTRKTLNSVINNYREAAQRVRTTARNSGELTLLYEDHLLNAADITRLDTELQNQFDAVLNAPGLGDRYIPGRDVVLDQQFTLFKSLASLRSGRTEEARLAANIARSFSQKVENRIAELDARLEQLDELQARAGDTQFYGDTPGDLGETEIPLGSETVRYDGRRSGRNRPNQPDTGAGGPETPGSSGPGDTAQPNTYMIPREDTWLPWDADTRVLIEAELSPPASVDDSLEAPVNPDFDTPLDQQPPYIEGLVDLKLRPMNTWTDEVTELVGQGDLFRVDGRADLAVVKYKAALIRFRELNPGADAPWEIIEKLRLATRMKHTPRISRSSLPELNPPAAGEADVAFGLVDRRDELPESIVRKLDVNSMNDIYEVNPPGGRRLAVKHVQVDGGLSESMARQLVEAEVIAGEFAEMLGIRMPKMITHQVKDADGNLTGFYLAMEWLEGSTMDKLTMAEIFALKEQFAEHKLFSLLIGDFDRKLDNYLVRGDDLIPLDAGVATVRHYPYAVPLEEEFTHRGGPLNHWYFRAGVKRQAALDGLAELKEEWTYIAPKLWSLERSLTFQDLQPHYDRMIPIVQAPGFEDEFRRRMRPLLIQIHGDVPEIGLYLDEILHRINYRSNNLYNAIRNLNRQRNNIPLGLPARGADLRFYHWPSRQDTELKAA